MDFSNKYYIVAADALPEVFVKVAQAKQLMIAGEAETVGEATKMVGISRSAFYKYKDSIQPLSDIKMNRIVSFYTVLKDSPGVLSRVLSIFSGTGANILTINQGVPTGNCACVTISAETTDMATNLEELIEAMSRVDGVIRFELLAG
ncbi:MAG: ACT domain-containing protein [Oscillospiraceae bacterium]|nr:ACT domain-containing protein [Oscillospiraceae bacterium]